MSTTEINHNHVYVAIIVCGLHPRILQVPLDGGEAKIGRLDPDYYIGEDSHRYFTLSVDKTGYIHVVGGMHGGPWRHWISARPEDVSNECINESVCGELPDFRFGRFNQSRRR